MGWLVESKSLGCWWKAHLPNSVLFSFCSPVHCLLWSLYDTPNGCGEFFDLVLSTTWLVSDMEIHWCPPEQHLVTGSMSMSPMCSHMLSLSHSHPLISQQTLVQTTVTRLVTNVRLLGLKNNFNNSFINNSIRHYHVHSLTWVLRSWL